MKGDTGITVKFLGVAAVLFAGIILFVVYGHPTYGRSAMAGDYKGVIQAEKPQIDTIVPARVETATFSLG